MRRLLLLAMILLAASCATTPVNQTPTDIPCKWQRATVIRMEVPVPENWDYDDANLGGTEVSVSSPGEHAFLRITRTRASAETRDMLVHLSGGMSQEERSEMNPRDIERSILGQRAHGLQWKMLGGDFSAFMIERHGFSCLFVVGISPEASESERRAAFYVLDHLRPLSKP
jgi:hypothetical protein